MDLIDVVIESMFDIPEVEFTNKDSTVDHTANKIDIEASEDSTNVMNNYTLQNNMQSLRKKVFIG